LDESETAVRGNGAVKVQRASGEEPPAHFLQIPDSAVTTSVGEP
jgi:hypothetical protein